VLYGQDCASYPEALALVERVRAELGIDAEVLTTLVTAPAGAATASNPTTARCPRMSGTVSTRLTTSTSASTFTPPPCLACSFRVRWRQRRGRATTACGSLRRQQLIEGDQPPFRLSADVRYSLLLEEYPSSRGRTSCRERWPLPIQACVTAFLCSQH
jgi:hypothetical protein